MIITMSGFFSICIFSQKESCLTYIIADWNDKSKDQIFINLNST